MINQISTREVSPISKIKNKNENLDKKEQMTSTKQNKIF